MKQHLHRKWWYSLSLTHESSIKQPVRRLRTWTKKGNKKLKKLKQTKRNQSNKKISINLRYGLKLKHSPGRLKIVTWITTATENAQFTLWRKFTLKNDFCTIGPKIPVSHLFSAKRPKSRSSWECCRTHPGPNNPVCQPPNLRGSEQGRQDQQRVRVQSELVGRRNPGDQTTTREPGRIRVPR